MKKGQLSVTVMNELCQIMANGNPLIKECAKMMGLKHRVFRGQLFKNKLDTSNLIASQLDKLNAAKPLILEVRDKCESLILSGFDGMVQQQAKAAAANNFDPHNSYYDFYQEGKAALIDAIYSYSDLAVKFKHYTWRCIQRRIVSTINGMNALCPLTNEAVILRKKFQEQKSLFNGPVTDDEVVVAMGLTANEREVLFSSTTKVINEFYYGESEGEDDYTGNRRNVDRDTHEVYVDRNDARQALKDANLDGFELDCILADMFPYHGWKEDVASKHVNPRTGERYTRQNVQYTLDRAKKKVRETFMNPPKEHKENAYIDQFFEEMSGKGAV